MSWSVNLLLFFLSTGWQKTVSLYFRTPLSLTLIDHCSARSRSRNYRRAKYNKHCENNNTHLLQSDRRIWDAFVKSSQWVRIRSFETSAILMIIKIRKIWLNYKSVVDSELFRLASREDGNNSEVSADIQNSLARNLRPRVGEYCR